MREGKIETAPAKCCELVFRTEQSGGYRLLPRRLKFRRFSVFPNSAVLAVKYFHGFTWQPIRIVSRCRTGAQTLSNKLKRVLLPRPHPGLVFAWKLEITEGFLPLLQLCTQPGPITIPEELASMRQLLDPADREELRGMKRNRPSARLLHSPESVVFVRPSN